MEIGTWIKQLRSWVSRYNKHWTPKLEEPELKVMICDKQYMGFQDIPEDFSGVIYAEGVLPFYNPEKRCYPCRGFVLCQNGQVHNRTGPAVFSNDYIGWYLKGRKVSPEKVFEQLTEDEKFEAIWNIDKWKK